MQPLVGIIMGSVSDWETMSHAADKLTELGVPYEVEVVYNDGTPTATFGPFTAEGAVRGSSRRCCPVNVWSAARAICGGGTGFEPSLPGKRASYSTGICACI